MHAALPCVTINSTQVTASARSQGEQREGVGRQRGINGWCLSAFVTPAQLNTSTLLFFFSSFLVRLTYS